MNYRMLGYLLSAVALIEAVLMMIPVAVSLIYGEAVWPFLITSGILLALSLPLVIFPPKNRRIFAKEGFVCVSGAWIMLSLFGALPFVLSGAIPNYIDAVFETVSGFTTTGATILAAIEHLPKGILFWRSFTHWIGGMGVLVFMLALLPTLDGQAIHLLRAEVPGPTKGKLVPKIRQTAIILYGIYLALTIAQTIALLCTGMSLYDSIVSSLATAGTGGFSVKNLSIAGYATPAAEWIIAIFMVIFGINFNMYYFILIKRAKDVWKSEELRAYLAIVTIATALLAINTYGLFDSLSECIRAAFFQTTSIISTTGFVTVNYDEWGSFAKGIIVLLTCLGACAGSTAGGLKLSRVILVVKNIFKEIKHVLRPNSVNIVRLDGESVSDETLRGAANYFSIYFVFIVISTLIVSIDGFSLETNLSAVLACINNVGPGLGMVGPVGNFSGFSYFSKIVLALTMLAGRLEFIPLIIFFSPSAWKRSVKKSLRNKEQLEIWNK